MSRMAVAVALAGALLLAGCNGGGDPEPLDPSTMDGLASSIEPNTPQTDDPTDEATEEETFDPAKETARQFIERWMEVSVETQVTGDTAAYYELHDDSCLSCSNFVEEVNAIHEAGGYVKVEPSRIVDLRRDTKNQWTVRLRTEGTEYSRGDGEPVESLPSGEYVLIVYLYRDEDGAWRLLDFENE